MVYRATFQCPRHDTNGAGEEDEDETGVYRPDGNGKGGEPNALYAAATGEGVAVQGVGVGGMITAINHLYDYLNRVYWRGRLPKGCGAQLSRYKGEIT